MVKYAFLVCAAVCVLAGCEGVAALFHGEKPRAKYTVTFDANGASGTVPSQSASAGDAITLPYKESMSYEGKIFVGWSETHDSVTSSGARLEAYTQFTVRKSIVLYAQWIDSGTPRYTIIFDANGAEGDAPPSKTDYKDLTVTLPSGAGLSFAGNIFDGWDTNTVGTGTRYTASSEFRVTADARLYAAWKRAAGDTNGAYARSAWRDEHDNRVLFGGHRAWLSGEFFGVNNDKTFDSEYRIVNLIPSMLVWTNRAESRAIVFRISGSALETGTTVETTRTFSRE